MEVLLYLLVCCGVTFSASPSTNLKPGPLVGSIGSGLMVEDVMTIKYELVTVDRL